MIGACRKVLPFQTKHAPHRTTKDLAGGEHRLEVLVEEEEEEERRANRKTNMRREGERLRFRRWSRCIVRCQCGVLLLLFVVSCAKLTSTKSGENGESSPCGIKVKVHANLANRSTMMAI